MSLFLPNFPSKKVLTPHFTPDPLQFLAGRVLTFVASSRMIPTIPNAILLRISYSTGRETTPGGKSGKVLWSHPICMYTDVANVVLKVENVCF